MMSCYSYYIKWIYVLQQDQQNVSSSYQTLLLAIINIITVDVTVITIGMKIIFFRLDYLSQ